MVIAPSNEEVALAVHELVGHSCRSGEVEQFLHLSRQVARCFDHLAAVVLQGQRG